jgi:ubiquinol-cytochrome c reductase cytochrome c subunit
VKGRGWRRLALVWLPLLVVAAVGGWLLVPTGGSASASAPTSGSAPSPRSSARPAPPGAGGVPAAVLYRQDCAACHGDNGKGTSRGPDLTGVGEAAVDFMLSTGRMPKRDAPSKLPPYSPILPRADVQALDQYVTDLVAAGGPGIPAVDPASGDPAHGQELFNDECAACHGWGGAGGILFSRPVPKITEATPTQVGEALRVGPAAMPVFGPHQISQSQLNDIDAYIESLKHPYDAGGDPISHLGPVAEGAIIWLIAVVGLIFVIRWIGERG